MATIIAGYDTNEEANQLALKRVTLTTCGTKELLNVEVPFPFEERFDYDSQGRMIYWGVAEPGAQDTEAKWRIQKLLYVPGTRNISKRSWANYDAKFDKIWDNRATYNYR